MRLRQGSKPHKIVKIAKEHVLITILDNTFVSSYPQRPIELGSDIVIHRVTKFIGGRGLKTLKVRLDYRLLLR
nr:MAG: hypothetical protein DIU64_12145 [Caldicoprobacter oshimai]